MKLREISAADAPPAPTYAQAVEVTGATRWLFVSGQIPVDGGRRRAGQLRGPGAARLGQRDSAIARRLMTLDNLVKVTIFLSDRKYIADYRRTRDEALGGRRVGLTTIITGIFDEKWLLEIEAVAAA